MQRYSELRGMSDAELIRTHDKIADQMATSATWYLDELDRRVGERRESSMLRMTRAVLLLTIVNVALVAYEILK